MSLPIVPLRRDTVEVGGQPVGFHGLSRKEALHVGTAFKDNPDGAENYILACGCDVSEDEASKWRAETDPTEAGKLIDGIIYLSGLAQADPKDPAA